MISQAKLYAAGSVLLAVLGLSATIWVQGGRIDRLKAEVKALTADVTRAVDANKVNDATIQELKAERVKANKSCEKRLADADAKADALRTIDEKRRGGHEQAGSGAVGSACVARIGGSDDLSDALNGVLPGQGGGPDGVHQAAGPAGAEGTQMVSCSVRYCFCDDTDVKNFLKDWVLCRAWGLDGMQAIEGMK